MRRLFGVLFFLLVCVVAIGFYRGWFSMSTNTDQPDSSKVDVNLSVDTDKVKADAEILKEKAVELSGDVKDEAGRLGGQAEGKRKSE